MAFVHHMYLRHHVTLGLCTMGMWLYGLEGCILLLLLSCTYFKVN